MSSADAPDLLLYRSHSGIPKKLQNDLTAEQARERLHPRLHPPQSSAMVAVLEHRLLAEQHEGLVPIAGLLHGLNEQRYRVALALDEGAGEQLSTYGT